MSGSRHSVDQDACFPAACCRREDVNHVSPSSESTTKMGGGISRTKSKPTRIQQGRLLHSPGLQSPGGSASKQAQAAPLSSTPERCVTMYHGNHSEKEKDALPGRLRTVRAPGGPLARPERGSVPRPHTQSACHSIDEVQEAEARTDEATLHPKEKDYFSINRSNFILENAGKIQSLYDIDPTTLGSGTYGSVSRAVRRSTGMQRAIKTISKSQVKSIERFRREIDIMKSLVRLDTGTHLLACFLLFFFLHGLFGFVTDHVYPREVFDGALKHYNRCTCVFSPE